ncbi:hypothetical protein A4E84_25685 [Streptomyces qaidamensis]|uniref:PknH-like extracellular domain-containing protein n=1 Tax=Streptomyces qaidamensis TaxID=1783515 RepID=A0A143C515_9ACTN|nr:hypothetical protein [Streptomyces qaidamensis]AMW12576.1 hypothetical protein A4E84_25685 [Streptomyces qaidamensis]
MRMKARRAGVGSLLIAATVVSVTGCSGDATTAKPSVATPKPTVPFDAADPATWVLPIEGYLPSETERKQISQARKILVGTCMKGFGFSWEPAADLPRLGGKTLVDWRYGIHDMALAEERGYKPAAEEQEAYDRAVEKGALDGASGTGPDTRALEGGVKEVGGKPVPEGGCLGEADRKISAGGANTTIAQTISNETFARSQQVPEVVEAFEAWSACMKKSGFDYARPLDASDDPRFGSQGVTPLEISTATADISCRDKTKVAKVWFDAEVAMQKEEIESGAERLNGERKSLNSAVKKAARVIAGS